MKVILEKIEEIEYEIILITQLLRSNQNYIKMEIFFD